MAKLYDHKRGTWVIADEDRVDELVNSGNYTFEDGIEIPVVFPDGDLGTISSREAQTAWSEGFRWPTAADTKADFDRKNDAIKREASTAASTFGLSTLSGGTLGATDAILAGAEAVGVPGTKGFKEARNFGKETSPIADVAGTVTGAVGSTLLSGGTGLLGAAGTAGRGAKAVNTAVEGAMVSRGVGTLGTNIAKGAAEGAYWSAGEAVSDVVLGKPEEVIDNLVTNVGLGVLTGGAFGSAIGGAEIVSPYLKKATEATLNYATSGTKSIAKNLVKGIVQPVMTLKGQADAAKIFGDLAEDENFVKFYTQYGEKAAREYAKAAKVDAQTLTRESKSLSRAIKQGIDDATVDEKQYLTDALAATNQDVRRALNNTYDELKDIGTAFDNHRATMVGTPHYGTNLTTRLGMRSKELSKYGPAAKGIAKEIDDLVAAHARNMTDGTEVSLLRDVKALVNQDARASVKGTAHDKAKEVWSDVDNLLKNYPDEKIASYASSYDTLYGSYANLNRTFSKNIKKGGGAENFLFNPDIQRQIGPMINDLNAFFPEFKAIQAAGSDIKKSADAYKQLMTKYRTVANESVTPENMAQFKEIVQDIVKDPKILSNTKRLEEVQNALLGLDTMSPLDAAVKMKLALGQDVTELQKYAKFSTQFDKLKSIDGAPTDSLLDYGLISASGPIGGAIVAANRLASNPSGALKLIGHLQKTAQKGSDLLKNSLNKAATSITSKPVRMVSAQLAQRNMSRKEQEERFTKVKRSVADLAAPANMANAIEQLAGDTQNIPSIKLAIGLRLQTANQYLVAQLPQDPLAAYAVGPTKSPWKASDMEMVRYLRKVDAINNPIQVIDRVADGTVTKDEVDAIKNVHPDVYKRLQNSLMGAIMDHGDSIPYARRVQLNLLFNIPTDYSLTPQFIAQMQAPYQPKDLGGRPEGSRSKNIDISPFDSVQTETDRITYNDKA